MCYHGARAGVHPFSHILRPPHLNNPHASSGCGSLYPSCSVSIAVNVPSRATSNQEKLCVLVSSCLRGEKRTFVVKKMNLNFNGSLDDFRSLMLYLESQHGGCEWTLPSGARLVIQRSPDAGLSIHASWVVSIPIDVDGSNKRHATIQAFKRAEGSVVLVEDRQRIASSGNSQALSLDRAIGPLFHELCHELQSQIDHWVPSPAAPHVHRDSSPAKDPGDAHFAYPPDTRREIVQQYRVDQRAGKVLNKDIWAQSKHSISSKTLKRYEEEFPELPEHT